MVNDVQFDIAVAPRRRIFEIEPLREDAETTSIDVADVGGKKMKVGSMFAKML